ncbi:Xaa-Pro peptidase family protein [Lentilactobacillus sp. Marseille-Q4993]|uniref:M24 family metallopeptidase n=1 Tax=Lentilactobacillus sp. Marseille-Q4993 TaxID=3039492 RepID=UPI0024BCAC5E|nr:Xaa-Pro peptidase family protein [Lentilactobacillus sp. Marseille-Q4993]
MTTRLDALRASFEKFGIDSIVITNPFSLYYFVGFAGLEGDGCLAVTKTKAELVTDARYQDDLPNFLPDDIGFEITRAYYSTAQRFLDGENASHVGFEGTVSYDLYRQLAELFGDKLVPTSGLVEKQREVKDKEEIAALRKATRVTSESYTELLRAIQPGWTELQAANWLNNWMLEHGATKPSFDTIVASGFRSALPHGSATSKEIKQGELVTVDYGYYFDGYTSDMTRTFAVGDPGEELKHVYDVVAEAQARMIDVMIPGKDGKTVDAAGRDYITEQGYGKEYNHGSGHGIGLDIHEGPNMGMRFDKEILVENNVVTAEPGVYLVNKGGVRIEDDLLITKAGNEVLTTAPKQLIII